MSQIVVQTNPKSILLMGMGAGAVLSILPKDAKIDAVEIDPRIVEVAKNYDLIPDRDYKIFYDDARRFVRKEDKKYDLVIMDLAQGYSPPFYMLTEESFQDIKKLIKEGGVFYINFSVTPTNDDDPFLVSVVKTLNQVFDKVEVVSARPDKITNFNILVSPKYKIEWDKFYSLTEFNLSKAAIITDNYNPLEGYYLPYLLDARSGEKTLGIEIYLTN
ncbi:unnamed protein product [marine sediment metagenome]|uniref:PABS domain-containing protein n=1 Tax=marine sediment metagenome TaxID=412755 RepID=X1NN76_9ZZZZ